MVSEMYKKVLNIDKVGFVEKLFWQNFPLSKSSVILNLFLALNLIDLHLPVLAILEVLFMFKLLPKRHIHKKTSNSTANNWDTECDSNSGQLHKGLGLSGLAKVRLLFDESYW